MHRPYLGQGSVKVFRNQLLSLGSCLLPHLAFGNSCCFLYLSLSLSLSLATYLQQMHLAIPAACICICLCLCICPFYSKCLWQFLLLHLLLQGCAFITLCVLTFCRIVSDKKKISKKYLVQTMVIFYEPIIYNVKKFCQNFE